MHAVAVDRRRLEFKDCAAYTGSSVGEASAVLAAYCALAQACTAPSPAERPTAAEVVAALQGLIVQCGDSSIDLHTVQVEHSSAAGHVQPA